MIEGEVLKLQEEQSVLEEKVDKLRNELKDTRERKRRADTLLRSLVTEKQKWLVCARMLDNKFANIIGDVLLGAAYITFLPGFTRTYRHKLL